MHESITKKWRYDRIIPSEHASGGVALYFISEVRLKTNYLYSEFICGFNSLYLTNEISMPYITLQIHCVNPSNSSTWYANPDISCLADFEADKRWKREKCLKNI